MTTPTAGGAVEITVTGQEGGGGGNGDSSSSSHGSESNFGFDHKALCVASPEHVSHYLLGCMSLFMNTLLMVCASHDVT